MSAFSLHPRFFREWGFVFLVWLRRDLLSRYAGSFGGVLWSILNPVLTVAVFYVVFAVVLKVRIPELASDSGYFYYLLAGLLPWMGMADALARAAGSLAAQEQFIQKTVFPIEIIPATAVVGSLVPQLVGFVILLILLAYGGVLHVSSLVWLPLLLLLQLVFTLGFGALLAILTVHVRDIAQLVPVLLQIFFYLTPIIYARSMVPAEYHHLYVYNPFAGLIDLYQHMFLGLPLNMSSLLSAVIWMLLAGVGGALLFRALKPTLGDYL